MRRDIYKIGIVGKGSQFKRVSNILVKKKIKFFCYKPNNKNYFNIKEFEKLKKCKIIFILSPNKTHYNYLNKLKNGRYIFCEKPPVVSKKDLLKLNQQNNGKIFFNFNFRYSALGKIFKNLSKYCLGNLLYSNISIGHGMAFKKEYKKNWRSKIKYCKKGVFEIVSIHWIDLINYYFKISNIQKPVLLNFLKKGSSYDNSFVKIILKNRSQINIFTSYSSPLVNNILFVFTNGIIEQNNERIEIRGPAKNFDNNNFFIRPKLIKKIKINFEKDYLNSLEDSIEYFLDTARKKKKFEKKDFKCSIDSNKLIL